MSSLRFCLAFSLLCLSLIAVPSLSQICPTQKFTTNNLYTHCVDLPTLDSYLHFSYNPTNTTLSIAFRIPSVSSTGGWASWAINPASTGMVGAQALVAYKDPKLGSMVVKTYNVGSYSSNSVVQSKLAFQVWDESVEDQGGFTTIFSKIKLSEELAAKGSVNQVWQVGPGVDDNGLLRPHAMRAANLNANGVLDLNGGLIVLTNSGTPTTTTTATTTTSGGRKVDSKIQWKIKWRNIHGILNAVSWGFLFPLGIIIARYMRMFKAVDPLWFYLHIGCQLSAYLLGGLGGWITGMVLGRQSKGITWTAHRNIGITLFAIATIQMFAMFLRPGKEHKYRMYWNIYHRSVGYAIVVLGILNVFKGIDILQPDQYWKSAYIVAISILGGIAVLLEIATWIVVLRRRSNSAISTDENRPSYDNAAACKA